MAQFLSHYLKIGQYTQSSYCKMDKDSIANLHKNVENTVGIRCLFFFVCLKFAVP